MAYFVCKIKTEYQTADTVISLLTENGALGCAAEGAPLIRDSIAAGNAEIWDRSQLENDDPYVTVTGFFAADDGFPEKKDRLIAAVAVYNAVFGGDLKPSFSRLEDETWQDGWKQYYKPFRVGERLVVKPSWETYAPQKDDLVIELDPGLAFGTGSHPTTNGALRLLEKYVRPGGKVIDCGCGSGILSVAAGLLGAKKVFAVDIDHEAILATVKNTRVNHLFTTIDVFYADITKKDFHYMAPFQAAAANIVADVIIPMLPHIGPLMEESGILIAGGIISHRKEEVYEALTKNSFAVLEALTDGDWLTLAAIKE